MESQKQHCPKIKAGFINIKTSIIYKSNTLSLTYIYWLNKKHLYSSKWF